MDGGSEPPAGRGVGGGGGGGGGTSWKFLKRRDPRDPRDEEGNTFERRRGAARWQI